MRIPDSLVKLRDWIAPMISGPSSIAFLPAISLAAFWFGGEIALLLTALGLPLLFAATGLYSRHGIGGASGRDRITELIMRDGFERIAADIFARTGATRLKSVCILIDIDHYRDLVDLHGQAAADQVIVQCGQRIQGFLRASDTLARLGDNRFGVCTSPIQQLDLETCISLAGRIQAALEDPIQLDGMSLYLSCSIGFCQRSRAPGKTSDDWIAAAATALADAQLNGPSAIRAFSLELHRRVRTRRALHDEAADALENGQIVAWYQPQVSSDTGKVTGFEALARWNHPEHGMIPPNEFLPILEEAGLGERLGQIMLQHALGAVKAWDEAGFDVPMVGVNFATDELRNPTLVDRIKWEVDRFDLTPERLCVEILETVVTSCSDDMVTRNVLGLGKLGCHIDLDDFGTGHASIASIRRFAISRIKIDRSFVLRADLDPEQQRMIGAILTMAERLGIETLAEGVETAGEHVILAQLGCDHVQGFGIARPMPFEKTLSWLTAHRVTLIDTPILRRDTG
ncbi:putative bifunctional diguanylate cyclase/phosphodiesterase [Heliomarina baculiformis]|uniref:putative bifunctional diguanylate cyclase/phosphodiesterase n=1 Tax=Heliomarina baculiformis TaxID=2872036 RepID=UPI001EE2841A|nr:bifunctional diguanylate cyclase/phosphodiesterase [Heliomarina baculiformis]